ncbi:MBL fold metallo-hydrolase [Candidatus Kaiserbacteria bacterium]|nr:MBL fold metallo-hydrolase [Candidatus Kaiserbacteria bacterium]
MNTIHRYSSVLIVATFFSINLFIWSAVFADGKEGVLTVAFLDVGQGDAIFIEAPNGNQMLVDGGRNPAVLRELGEVMSFSDRTIDVVVATHPDKDHISGLIDVFRRYDINTFLYSGVMHDTGEYRTLLNTVSEEGIAPTLVRRGMRVVLGGGVFAEILFPDRDVSHVETNLGSIVLRVVYGETEVMLTGDSPQSIEKYLVSISGRKLESDILKAGHHGSKTSSAESFVGLVNPEFAIISAGKDNSYGHPHKEVMEIFERLGIETINTADAGTIIFTSDGTTFTQK